jgi:hypothetical protein
MAPCFGKHVRAGNKADMKAGPIGDFKSPMLKAALVTNMIRQHVLCDHFGVPSRFLVPWQLVTLGVGDSLAPAHDDIEKVSRHGREITMRSKGR